MTLHRLLVLSLACACAAAQTPVLVSVFYESRCPDSEFFITSQLKPTFDALGAQRMTVDLVPYGKATHVASGGGFVFTNQHGHQEYLDNKMQACAIEALLGAGAADTVNFVACAMAKPSSAASVDGACFNGIAAEVKRQIGQCQSGIEGDRLLVRHGDRTHALYPKISLRPNQGYIPRVVINGVYNEAEDQMSSYNLKGLICSKFQGLQHQECLTAMPASVPQKNSRSLQGGYYAIPPTAAYPWAGYNPYPSYPTAAASANLAYPSYPVQAAYPYPTPAYQPQAPYPYPIYRDPYNTYRGDAPLPYANPAAQRRSGC